MQEGKNFIKTLAAVPQVAEASGSISYSFPIEIPAGRGVTPRVELQYASGARNSEFGWGWALTIPMITRTQRLGVVAYDGNLFTYREGHATRELVPTGAISPTGAQEYKERTEQTFSRYLFYSASNQWRVTTPTGVSYELGTANGARRGKNVNFGVTGTSEWLVTRILDTNRNYVTYEYVPGATRQPRIATIRYTGNFNTGLSPLWTIAFSWSTHFDARANSFRSGYERIFGADRLNSIIVTVPPHSTTGNPALVPTSSPQTKTYQFTYSNINASVDRIFQLASAQLAGLPTVNFVYSNPTDIVINDTEVLIDTVGQNYPGHLGFTASSSGESRTRSTLIDVTGDARPDLIEATGDTTWTVWKNTGGLFNRTFWHAPDDFWTASVIPDPRALRVVSSGRTVQDFFDLDGDGFPDLMWIVGSSQGPIINYCRGTGTGFEWCEIYGGGAPNTIALREENNPSADTTVTYVDFADMNGDGLPDILYASGTTLYVHYNRGRTLGFMNAAVTSVLPPCPYPVVTACLRVSQRGSYPGANRRQLADVRDVNGDGLADFIVNDYYTNELKIAYGDGRGFRNLAATGRYLSIGLGNQSGATDYFTLEDMSDANGDGQLDFIRMDCSSAPRTYSVWFNNGGVWDTSPRNYEARPFNTGHFDPCGSMQRPTTVNGENGVATMSSFVDFNADGTPDFVTAPLNPVMPFSVRVAQRLYRAPRLMLRVDSVSNNHQLDITWQAAADAGPAVQHVPGVLNRTITQLYPGQPERARSKSVSYFYEKGSFDPDEREFAGFATVLSLEPLWGKTTTTMYGTTLVDRGLVHSRHLRNNTAGGVGEDVYNLYTFENLGAGRTFARLDQTNAGPPVSPPAVTTFENHFFGRPRRWVEQGHISVTGDEYVNERDYVLRSDDSFMLLLPAEERRQVGTVMTGTPIRTRYYYDDRVNFGVIPTAGNLVKVQRALNGADWIATESYFDLNGNVTQRYDEMGYTTTYTYDPSYARFVVRESNSVGTVFRSYHALYALEADQCGPQFSGSSYRCNGAEIDGFGRPIATWVPTLSGSTYTKSLLSTVSYQDTTYPLTTTITRRGVSHTVQYRDAVGNPVQLREEEWPGIYRVYDATFDIDGRIVRNEQPYRASGAQYSYAPTSSEAWTYEHDVVHGSIERVTHPREPGDANPPATATRTIGTDRTIVLDEDGRRTEYLQDAYRRVTQVQRYDGTTHNDTTFIHDVHGQVASVTDALGNVTLYQRNLVGWTTTVTPPGLAPFTYNYNPRGQISSSNDQRGVSVTYGYDTPGRLTSITSLGGGTQVRQINAALTYYDSATDTKQIGWLRTESSDNVTQLYAYNAEHNIASHQVTAFGVSGTVSFAYDIGGLLRRVSYPGGVQAGYEYNLLEQPATVLGEDPTFLGMVFASFNYHDNGQPYELFTDPGLLETYTYDARGRRTSVVSLHQAFDSTPLVHDTVTLSNAGDVTTLTRRGLKPGRIVRMTPDIYVITNDAFHQVTRVELNGALAATYAYDGTGRLTSFNETGSTDTSVSTYSYDRLTQRTTGSVEQTWNFDAAGLVTSDGRIELGTSRQRGHRWDALQRYSRTTVLDGTTTQYFYTPSGEISRVIAPGDLPSNVDNIHIGKWARVDASTGIWTSQVHANGKLVFEITGQAIEMPHRALDESVLAVTDGQGNILRQEEYAPYGSRISGNSGGRFELHYQGLRSDELVIAGGRAYDSQAGRWLARDRAHVNPANFLTEVRLVDMYGFDFSNPFAFRDPSGRTPEGGWVLVPDADVPYMMWVENPADYASTGSYFDSYWEDQNAKQKENERLDAWGEFHSNAIGMSGGPAAGMGDPRGGPGPMGDGPGPMPRVSRRSSGTGTSHGPTSTTTAASTRLTAGAKLSTGYVVTAKDRDMRGQPFREALGEAFARTGVPKKDFVVTKWGPSKEGKSYPVEWRAKGGAEVSVDIGHKVDGPDVPHIGWQQSGKKRTGAEHGHIFVDEVPYNR